jgi:hypothetical protein
MVAGRSPLRFCVNGHALVDSLTTARDHFTIVVKSADWITVLLDVDDAGDNVLELARTDSASDDNNMHIHVVEQGFGAAAETMVISPASLFMTKLAPFAREKKDSMEVHVCVSRDDRTVATVGVRGTAIGKRLHQTLRSPHSSPKGRVIDMRTVQLAPTTAAAPHINFSDPDAFARMEVIAAGAAMECGDSGDDDDVDVAVSAATTDAEMRRFLEASQRANSFRACVAVKAWYVRVTLT